MRKLDSVEVFKPSGRAACRPLRSRVARGPQRTLRNAKAKPKSKALPVCLASMGLSNFAVSLDSCSSPLNVAASVLPIHVKQVCLVLSVDNLRLIRSTGGLWHTCVEGSEAQQKQPGPCALPCALRVWVWRSQNASIESPVSWPAGQRYATTPDCCG